MTTSSRTFFASALAIGALALISVPATASTSVLSTLNRLSVDGTSSNSGISLNVLPDAPATLSSGVEVASSAPMVDAGHENGHGIRQTLAGLSVRGTTGNSGLGGFELPDAPEVSSGGVSVAGDVSYLSSPSRGDDGVISRIHGLNITSRESGL